MNTMPANSIELIPTEKLMEELWNRCGSILICYSTRKTPCTFGFIVHAQPEFRDQLSIDPNPKVPPLVRVRDFMAQLREAVDAHIEEGGG